jgi:hypothetical protein
MRIRVSEYYKLSRKQGELDFVDVDIHGDSTVFLDPRALRFVDSLWGHECVSLIQNFFQHVLDLIRAGHDRKAVTLLEGLAEPNETHLGLSSGKAKGRGVGPHSASNAWRALSKSKAIKTGLLRDLEETILFIPGIGPDLISDMTTNIIRAPLIQYTLDACHYYNIATEEVDSGPLWDPQTGNWFNRYEHLPTVNGDKLLLVPKVIVRKKPDYSADEYFQHYVLNFLQEEEKRVNSELVQLLKNGNLRVYKKDLIEKYGAGKATITELSQRFPQILDNYRTAKEKIQPPLRHEEIAKYTGAASPDWDVLLQEVINVPVGKDAAYLYEDNVEKLLTALFYPHLTFPQKQYPVHEGRKRIDLTYDNIAKDDFFYWLALNYSASKIFIECKNYTSDPKNPELDQISGRFSKNRGTFGIILCRTVIDKDLFATRCRDTANDGRGYIIALDDNDLKEIINTRRDSPSQTLTIIRKKFNYLIQ